MLAFVNQGPGVLPPHEPVKSCSFSFPANRIPFSTPGTAYQWPFGAHRVESRKRRRLLQLAWGTAAVGDVDFGARRDKETYATQLCESIYSEISFWGRLDDMEQN